MFHCQGVKIDGFHCIQRCSHFRKLVHCTSHTLDIILGNYNYANIVTVTLKEREGEGGGGRGGGGSHPGEMSTYNHYHNRKELE